jgi:hypothetical protein
VLKAKYSSSYSGFQMSTHSFENKKSVPVRVLSFHFAVGKMKTAIGYVFQRFALTSNPEILLNAS